MQLLQHLGQVTELRFHLGDALLFSSLILRAKQVIWDCRQNGSRSRKHSNRANSMKSVCSFGERLPTNSTSARTYGSLRSTLQKRITEESLPSGIMSPDQGNQIENGDAPRNDDEIAAAGRLRDRVTSDTNCYDTTSNFTGLEWINMESEWV